MKTWIQIAAIAAGIAAVPFAWRPIFETWAPESSRATPSYLPALEPARARELGVDFVVLGPVLPTPSHPGAAGIGWETLAEQVRDYPVPVYALGGLKAPDLETALARGAHGIAMMRGAWNDAIQRSGGGASSS